MSTSSSFSLSAGVLVEQVGEDLIAIVPGETNIVTVSGHVADVLRDVSEGREVDVADPGLFDLKNLGIVSPRGVSRRSFLAAGALGAGAGIAVMALPAAALASSSDELVHLTGVWMRVVFRGAFVRTEFALTVGQHDFPDDYDNDTSNTNPLTRPGLLQPEATFGSLDSLSFEAHAPSGWNHPDAGDYVLWRYVKDGFSGDVLATFTWGNTSYQVTFTPAGGELDIGNGE